MTGAIIVAFHKYTPFGSEFYEPILDFFLQTMSRYSSEYHRIYLVDSNWNIDPEKLSPKMKILKVDPSLRYYDAYKAVLPEIKEDLVLFLDNDMVIYREGIIARAFEKLKEYDVVSTYDTIGTHYFNKLGGQSKFCPYFFATGTAMLRDFTDVEWGPEMPEYETLGRLTHVMLDDGVKPYEIEEDKSNCLFDGTQDGEKSKDLGYYHIRAGSTPAYLLATKKYGDQETYWKYLKEQPRNEYLRQIAWYSIMGGSAGKIADILWDIKPTEDFEQEFWDYVERFHKYHGL